MSSRKTTLPLHHGIDVWKEAVRLAHEIDRVPAAFSGWVGTAKALHASHPSSAAPLSALITLKA